MCRKALWTGNEAVRDVADMLRSWLPDRIWVEIVMKIYVLAGPGAST